VVEVERFANKAAMLLAVKKHTEDGDIFFVEGS
jgi:hypothetical protein